MGGQRVGTCSICGGSVEGIRGAWMGVVPPPPDTCQQCGAVAQSDVIKMVPRPGGRFDTGYTSPDTGHTSVSNTKR